MAGENLIDDVDIEAGFNRNYPNLYFGTDGNTPDGHYDFVTVVLHELCHGLGFFGLMKYEDGIGSYGSSGFSLPAIFDHFTMTRPGRQLVKEKWFPNPSEELGAALTGDQILFAGENVMSATKGQRALLYTWPTWKPGSSYSHLDEFEYPPGTENSLMTYALSSGESIHHPGPITMAIFNDIGWNGKVKKPFNPNASINSVAGGNTKDNIIVFPNPINNDFKVEFKKTSKEVIDVYLYDDHGKGYYLDQWSLKEKSHHVDLSALGLKKGFYYLSLEVSNEQPTVIMIYKK